jgi:hypothetical protein
MATIEVCEHLADELNNPGLQGEYLVIDFHGVQARLMSARCSLYPL